MGCYQSEDPCLGRSPFDRGGGGSGGEIEHGARWSGDGDAVSLVDILSIEMPDAVEMDAVTLTRAPTDHGDINRSPRRIDQSPEGSRTTMAE